MVADTVTSHKHLLHFINHGQKCFHPNQFQFVFEVDSSFCNFSRSAFIDEHRLCNKIWKSFSLFGDNYCMIISLNTYVTKKPDWIKNVIMSMIDLTNISLKLIMHWLKKKIYASLRKKIKSLWIDYRPCRLPTYNVIINTIFVHSLCMIFWKRKLNKCRDILKYCR